MSTIFRRLLMFWSQLPIFIYISNRSFLMRALALRWPLQGKVTEAEISFLYRLRMFISVTEAQPKKPLGWRGHFSQAVSHAACGHSKAARAALSAFLQASDIAWQRTKLAQDIYPYMPEDALRLIEVQKGIQPDVKAAFILNAGQLDRAKIFLNALPPGAERVRPTLHLLKNNAFGGTPSEKLERLNAYLASCCVSPLKLRDPMRAPSVTNVRTVEPVSAVRGPLVTVLMTTFRTGQRASAAIESILGQSYQDLELIVVDDASGDGTPDLMREWAKRDARMSFIPLRRNVGTYVAKLIGLQQARGEYITCHDSDDWSHPEKIARQIIPLIKDDRLIATMSCWLRMTDEGTFYDRLAILLMRPNPSSLLFRRDRVLREVGAWDCARTGADSEFNARLELVFGSRSVRKIRQVLALGSHRKDSLMRSIDTGYAATGASPQRLAYWEAWSRWHLQTLSNGRLPFITPDVMANAQQRAFELEGDAKSLLVRAEDVRIALDSKK